MVPYTFDDVVKGLNQVAPFDWASLLKERVDSIQLHAPIGGIERGGWRLVYNDQPNLFTKTSEKISENVNVLFSLGFLLNKSGQFVDVIPGSPAYAAGIGAGMNLIAVNGRRWSPEVLHAAIGAAQKDHQPIEFIVESRQFFKTYRVPYFDGEKNPHLERTDSKADLLSDILKSRAQ